MKEKRTLCTRCARDYRTAGFWAVQDGFQFIKSPCDLCGRPGFDYVIRKTKIKQNGTGFLAHEGRTHHYSGMEQRWYVEK